jgi:hypothetical protein
MSSFRKNSNNQIVEGFAPKKLVDVTLAVEWVPESDNVKFRVPSACTYKINGSANSGTLIAQDEIVILPGYTYIFDTTMVIEVM